MSILIPAVKSVKTSRLPLEMNEERVVSLKDAIHLVKIAEQVAFSCKLNSQGALLVVDVSRACALKNLRRQKGRVATLNVSDIFGTTVIG